MRSIPVMLTVVIACLGSVIHFPGAPGPLIQAQAGWETDLQRAWTKFAHAVQAHDVHALQQLSAPCIQCTECVTNTRAEAKTFETYQNEHSKTWYKDLYRSLSFIPAQDFWQQDSRLIFDDNTRARLLAPALLQFAPDDHNKGVYLAPCLIRPAQAASTHVYEVLLTAIEESQRAPGQQKAFAFVKTKQGYRFCGYSTIP